MSHVITNQDGMPGPKPPADRCPQCSGPFVIQNNGWRCFHCGMPASISLPIAAQNAEVRNRVVDRIDINPVAPAQKPTIVSAMPPDDVHEATVEQAWKDAGKIALPLIEA